MDYEKKYKEALEWMKDVYPTLQGAAKKEAEKHFPEIVESEDERIRKELLDYLMKFIPHNDLDLVRKSKVWITWLENQGEKGANGNNEKIPNSEQKTAWSEEDERIYNRIYDIVHSAAFTNYDVDEDGKECGEYAKIIGWFKKLKDRVGCEANCTTMWEPSDEELKALKKAVYEHFGIDGVALWHFYQDLKKLREK